LYPPQLRLIRRAIRLLALAQHADEVPEIALLSQKGLPEPFAFAANTVKVSQKLKILRRIF